MPNQFVHLHTHTDFSLLDGANKIKPLLARARELGMPALAITDHGSMAGAVQFYEQCTKGDGAPIKPIIGCEFYVASRRHTDKEAQTDQRNYHLILLAKNLTGYKNLMKLCSISWMQGFYYKPRIDHELLEQYGEGIICNSACLSGEVASSLLAGDMAKALRTVDFYKGVFGKENYFIEIQDHNLPDQARIREGLIQLAKDTKTGLVAANDCHYLKSDDAYAHEVMLCIQTNKVFSDSDRMRYGSQEFYVKSADEMSALFADIPEAIENTSRIADMVDLQMDFSRVHLPDPGVPNGDGAGYLRKLAVEGMYARYPVITDEAKTRLEYELSVIEQTGYPMYFLIVRDFAIYSRDKGIYYGVRGSAAGSMVSYCIGITDVDPLYYGLTFERFLNPERVSMPDIDMDFEDTRRGEVIEYVRAKYGEDHVSQIGTFGTIGAKTAIRDIGKVLEIMPSTIDKAAKAVPALPNVSLQSALETADMKQVLHDFPELNQVMEVAKRIEGVARHLSVHAAGVLICSEPLAEHVPLFKGKEGEQITQFQMNELEHIGLLKMDFLGLANLGVLGKAVAAVKRNHGVDIDILTIPHDDQKAWDMLGEGDTSGVFQLESEGMRKNIRELKPNKVQELAAMIALYRPGPLEHIPRFIRQKFGIDPIVYPHPKMESILEETYGVIVYQDQVMMIVRAIAGFSLGQADIMRKAMGKKNREIIEKMRAQFMEGAIKNGVPEKKASEIYTLIEPFAGYAFNKAHAVCYAIVAYQTAWLKANYPVEYFAASMSVFMEKEDKVIQYVDECRKRGIEVCPPDINASDIDFVTSEGKILFGLSAIKNVGRAAVETILEARGNTPFSSLLDFCKRVVAANGAIGKGVVETLIQVGAFTSIHENRAACQAALDPTWNLAIRLAKDQETGQGNLFGEDTQQDEVQAPAMPDVPDTSREVKMAYEKSALGMYLTDHPLKHLELAIRAVRATSCFNAREMEQGTEVTLAGIITNYRKIVTSTGKNMASFVLEDLSSSIQVTVFPFVYDRVANQIDQDKLVIIKGKVKYRDQVVKTEDTEDGDGPKPVAEIHCDSASALTDRSAPGTDTVTRHESLLNKTLHLRLVEDLHRPMLNTIKSLLDCYQGDSPIVFHVLENNREVKVRSRMRVNLETDITEAISKIMGPNRVWLQ